MSQQPQSSTALTPTAYNGRGTHSLWASIIILESTCRPVGARDIAIIAMEDRLVMRVSCTGFTFTVDLSAVTQVTLYEASAEVAVMTCSRGLRGTQGREYVLAPHAGITAARMLYDTVTRRLSWRTALRCEVVRNGCGYAAKTENVGNVSPFPEDVLIAAGLHQVTVVAPSAAGVSNNKKSETAAAAAAAAAAALRLHSNEHTCAARSNSDIWQSSVHPSLTTVYAARSPSSWHLQELRGGLRYME